jgi:rod shape-determining protein MreD
MKTAAVAAFVSVLVVLLQTTVAPVLGIAQVVPDFLLVWIAILGIRHGRFAATGAGFLLGLAVDLISGADGMLGLSAFCKSLAGFVAGSFYNENKTPQSLGGSTLIIATAAAALIHNIVYFLVFLQGSDIGSWEAILRYGLPATAYTTALALLPMFVFGRRAGA